jgi:hypothetical protein
MADKKRSSGSDDLAKRKRTVQVGARAHERPDDGRAFLPDIDEGGAVRVEDELAHTLAEEYISAATSAEEVAEDVRDQFVEEELGGPFVEADADEEFANDVDPNNPPGTEREAFPTPMRAPSR